MSNATVASAEMGRRYVLAAVALLVAVELVVIAAHLAQVGTDRLPQQSIRVLLLLGLGVALLRRQVWARWLTVALLLWGAWILTRPILAPGAFSGDVVWRTLPLLALFVGYGVVVRGMIYSASVRAYFARPTAGDAAEPSSPAV